MLSAVVYSGECHVHASVLPEAIARSLAALVPGVIDGIIRDVTLCVARDTPQAHAIADHAGCNLVEAATAVEILAKGLAAARGERILVLEAGFAPEAGFLDEVGDLFDRTASSAPDAAIMRVQPETMMQRLVPAFAPVRAIIARRAALAPGAGDLAALLRGFAAPVPLRTRLRRVV